MNGDQLALLNQLLLVKERLLKQGGQYPTLYRQIDEALTQMELDAKGAPAIQPAPPEEDEDE